MPQHEVDAPAQAGGIRDVEAGSSNLPTPTNMPSDQGING